MSQIEECTNNLIEAVKDSEEYLLYHKLLEQVMENKDLYSGINEFRKKSIAIQLNLSNNLLDISSALYSEYSSLLGNTLVVEFLSAEQGYCRLIRTMNEQIMECLDLDIDFLED